MEKAALGYLFIADFNKMGGNQPCLPHILSLTAVEQINADLPGRGHITSV